MSRQTVRVRLNPAVLAWARQSAGLDLPSTARTIGVTPDRLVAWEDGEDYPTISQLAAFARKVHRPLAALFLAFPPTEPRPPRDFRRLPGSELNKFSPKALLAFRDARNTLKRMESLFAEMEVRPAFSLPRASVRDNPAVIAHIIRSTLGVSIKDQMNWRDGYEALRTWRDLILDYGVLVVQYPLTVEELRGFSMTGGDLSLVGVSSQDIPAARIFSLFHEFYHLCLRRPGVSGSDTGDPGHLGGPRVVVERLSNSFAAEVLVPAEDQYIAGALADAARSLSHTDQPIRALATQLKVSKYVVLRQMLTLGLISRSRYNSTQESWLTTDRRRKPTGFSLPHTRSISRGGVRFSRLVIEAMDSGRISEREACSLLSVTPKWLGDVRGQLLLGGANE